MLQVRKQFDGFSNTFQASNCRLGKSWREKVWKKCRVKRASAWTNTIRKCLVVDRVKPRGSQNICSREPFAEWILTDEYFVLSGIQLEIRTVKWFPSPWPSSLSFWVLFFPKCSVVLTVKQITSCKFTSEEARQGHKLKRTKACVELWSQSESFQKMREFRWVPLARSINHIDWLKPLFCVFETIKATSQQTFSGRKQHWAKQDLHLNRYAKDCTIWLSHALHLYLACGCHKAASECYSFPTDVHHTGIHIWRGLMLTFHPSATLYGQNMNRRVLSLCPTKKAYENWSWRPWACTERFRYSFASGPVFTCVTPTGVKVRRSFGVHSISSCPSRGGRPVRHGIAQSALKITLFGAGT